MTVTLCSWYRYSFLKAADIVFELSAFFGVQL